MPFIIVRNDISQMEVDVIVNSANPLPQIGGGVDFAIHEVGGEELEKARIELGPINVGQVKYTPGYELKSDFVFHTVGPVWRGGVDGEDEDLYNCYYNSLSLALSMEIESIAFPLLSSGVYKYPKEESFLIARKAITDFLVDHELTVYLVVLDHDSFIVSKKYYNDIKQVARTGVHDFQLQREKRALKNRRIQAVRTMDHSDGLNYSISNDLDQIDLGFRDTLFELIDQKGYKDSEVYKRANLDRRLFSKIRNNPNYQPSKNTACALSIGLKLNITETRDLIARAGYALSPAFQFDVIISHFLKRRIYNIFDINEVLFDYDQDLLGSQ